MSIEECLGELELDWEWVDAIGGAPPSSVCWEGRKVSLRQDPPELLTSRERAAALFRKLLPELEAKCAWIDQQALENLWAQRECESLHFLLEEIPLDAHYRGPGFLEVQNALITPDMLCTDSQILLADYGPEKHPLIVRCGFFKKSCHEIGKFWRKHKTEIIVGAVILGLVIVVAVVDPFAAAPAAAAAAPARPRRR